MLKPKVVDLYESLFQVDSPNANTQFYVLTVQVHDEDFEQTEGFWRELFLLKPDPASLREIVGRISADDLLHHHEVRLLASDLL